MIPWLILTGMAWCGIRLFRRSVRPGINADHDVVAEAERALEGRASRAWLRPVVATTITWGLVSALLTPVDVSLAIWVGGAIITVGALATIWSIPDPTKIDDAAFDLEVQNLFEQYR